MRLSVIILLTVLSTPSHAVEKLSLTEFLRDLRQQLYNIEQQAGDQSGSAIIKNIHVEMNVIAEKDQQGNTVFYVLKGMVDKKDVNTQRISFDLELQGNIAASSNTSGYRTYSTRKQDYIYRPDRYPSPRPYPYPPNQYTPDIYPVILYNNER